MQQQFSFFDEALTIQSNVSFKRVGSDGRNVERYNSYESWLAFFCRFGNGGGR